MINNWVSGVDYPEWGNNDLYLQTISNGYLFEDETPKKAYERVCKRACEVLNRPDLYNDFFNIIWNGWLCLSTPVLSNFGLKRGLPISCFNSYFSDDMYEINRKLAEIAMMSKNGGGTSANFTEIRPSGATISNGGTSDGIIPFLKQLDSTIKASKQFPVRRGACAVYLDIKHKDYNDFLMINEGIGDPDRFQMKLQQGAVISDEFMNNLEGENKKLFVETLMRRVKRGTPYLMFNDNANNSKWWKNILDLPEINSSNLCNEIYLPTDKSHSFVCCLSSLNLLKYKQWKDWKGENNKSLVELAIYFLDAVMEDFIIKAKQIKGMSDAVRFAEKSRALGLGVLGWHSFLQSNTIPLESLEAKSWNKIIFKDIHTKALEASKKLAVEYVEPEWLLGTGRRNLTLEAIAPTVSNAKLSGGLSQGIEPYEANYYTDNDSKGSYAVKNPFLEKLLIQKNKNTQEVWNQINDNNGSVQTLNFLSDEEKSVFKTFREINQMELVKQAAERQPYIEQGQSLNLAFFYDAPAKWIYDVHYEAWKAGLKGLYYLRSQSALSNSNISNLYTNCISCEG